MPATPKSGGPIGPGAPARSVLMVLYFFPPVGGISTSRNIRNVEYLPRFGWSPVVVTPAEAGYPVKDPSLLDLVAPSVEVIRTGSIEAGHVREWVSWIGKFLRVPRPGRMRATRSEPIRDRGTTDSGSSAPREPDGLLFRIRRFVFFPDDQIGWLPFALRAALRRHRVAPVDVVYSTASPITSHLVAGLFKRRTGVPWVAEFRDPWLGTALAKPIPWLHRRIKAKVEHWIIRTADQVVFLAPSTARMYQERYPFATNFVVIPNGYDRSETSASSRPAEAVRRFRIVYTGLLFRPIELAVFLDGLAQLADRRPELVDQLEVVFYGAVDPTCQEVADRALTNERVSRIVEFRGYVPRREALQAVADADAALVLLGAGPGMGVYIPGKLFDYLGQSRQILAMIPKGDAWDVLDELNWGVAAEPDAVDVERAIERVMTLPPPAGPADPEGRYDRVVLAGRLSETLAEAAGPRTGPRHATVAERHDRTGGGANDRWTTGAAESRYGDNIAARVDPGRGGDPGRGRVGQHPVAGPLPDPVTDTAGAATRSALAHQALRVVVATDGPFRHWQARCVEDLAAVPGVTVVRWVCRPGRGSGANTRGESGALAQVSVPSVLRDIAPEDRTPPTSAVGSSPNPADILLDLTDRGLPESTTLASETWRFGYGKDLLRDPGWVALHDYVRGPGVTRVALISHPGRVIVRQGWLRTLSWWKGAPLESLLLDPVGWPAAAAFDRIHGQNGPAPTDKGVLAPSHRLPPAPRPLLTAAAVGRRAIGAADSLAGRDHWNVGFVQAPIHSFLDPAHAFDVHWLPARPEHYMADPFGMERDGVVHVFFEEYDQRAGVGSIGHVAIDRHGTISKSESVLNPGVHASYPYVVEQDGQIYMIPETAGAHELVLYAAHDFPYDWRPAATLLSGVPILDASVIERDGRWWMFATRSDRGGNQNLHIWHAPDLLGPWTPHVGNPVKTDARSSRPGGTPFVFGGQLYRPSQDDSLVYGGRLVVNRVDVLTPVGFAEVPAAVVEPPPGSPYPNGLHTLSSAGELTLIDGNRRQRTLKRFARNLAQRLPGRPPGR